VAAHELLLCEPDYMRELIARDTMARRDVLADVLGMEVKFRSTAARSSSAGLSDGAATQTRCVNLKFAA
jgi:hypothetical protein